MQTTPTQLKPAQHEVHRAAHEQDLIEVPKRALLDREAENSPWKPQSPVPQSIDSL